MSTFIPELYDKSGDQQTVNGNNDKYCEMCNKMSKKTRQLPACGHELCVKCLNKSLVNRSTWVDDKNDVLPCPKCGVGSRKLDLSLNATKPSKRTKGLAPSLDETTSGVSNLLDVDVRVKPNVQRQNKTKFYTTTDVQPSTDDIQSVLRSSAMPRLGQHRSAVRYSRHENYEGFESKLSTDTQGCLYFGGDLLENDYSILADWRNRVLKVYSKSGDNVCASEKFEQSPLHVTVMSDKVIVVTFGAKLQKVVFLSYNSSEKNLSIWGQSSIKNGFIYATTKFREKCIGILEIEDKTPCLAVIDLNESKIREGSYRKNVKNWVIGSDVPLSSESGLHYCDSNEHLYITHRRVLYCYNTDMKLLFKKAYENVGNDLYMISSIASDCRDCVYLASDQCILRVNSKTGGLQSTIPTDIDPYHVLMGYNGRFLILTGNQNYVFYCMLGQAG